MKKTIAATAVCCALLASGCARRGAEPNEAQKPTPAETQQSGQEKSLTRQTIEGMTGKTAVDAGQRTKAKVAIVNANEKEKKEGLDDIMSE